MTDENLKAKVLTFEDVGINRKEADVNDAAERADALRATLRDYYYRDTVKKLEKVTKDIVGSRHKEACGVLGVVCELERYGKPEPGEDEHKYQQHRSFWQMPNGYAPRDFAVAIAALANLFAEENNLEADDMAALITEAMREDRELRCDWELRDGPCNSFPEE